MFIDDKSDYKEFERGQAYYEQGDKNSGSAVPFLSELNKESGFGDWVNPITYWKDKIVAAIKPEQKQLNVSQTPISLASSHDGSNIVNAAINNPTALQTAPPTNPAGTSQMSAGVSELASATIPGAGMSEMNKGLLVAGGITVVVVGLAFFLDRSKPSN
jgi:hypothetical protein